MIDIRRRKIHAPAACLALALVLMLVPYAGEPASLRELVIGGLEAAGPAGISPVVEGRICNTEREGPCLAVASGDPP